MAAAAGAAEVPALGALVIGLAAALAFVVLVGLRYSWDYTLGAILNALAGVKIPLPAAPDIHPFSFLAKFDHRVRNAMLEAAQASEHAMGYMFHAFGTIQGWIAREILALSRDTLEWATWLQRSHLPRWLKAAIYAAVPPALLARLIHAAIHADLPHLARALVVHTVHTVTHTVTRIAHATTGAVALPRWVIHVPHRLRVLERQRGDYLKRLRRVEALVGVTGFAIAISRVLGLRDWRCLTRGNIGRGARAFCGLEKGLVDLVLLGTVEAFVATDLCGFASLLTKEAELVRPALIALVDVEDALIGCGGTTKSAPFRLPPLTLPGVVGTSALAV